MARECLVMGVIFAMVLDIEGEQLFPWAGSNICHGARYREGVTLSVARECLVMGVIFDMVLDIERE